MSVSFRSLLLWAKGRTSTLCLLPLSIASVGCSSFKSTSDDHTEVATVEIVTPELKQNSAVRAEQLVPPVTVASETIKKVDSVAAIEVIEPINVKASAEPQKAEPSFELYTVQGGETLYRIATKLYNSPARWKEIFELNRDVLPKPEALKIGMELKVPAGTTLSKKAPIINASVKPSSVKKVIPRTPLKRVKPVSTVLQLKSDDISSIGKRIYQNECSLSPKYLTTWNDGEEFPSFGIGHFIWFPTDIEMPFEETFPLFISFVRAKGVALPKLLQSADAPWKSRDEFLAQFNAPDMIELRSFLEKNISLQTEFIIRRAQSALPQMLLNVSADKRTVLRDKYYRVAQSKGGLYPLIDYVNFKGEGISNKERYKGQGWGLLQVLEQMRANTPVGEETLKEFYRSACFMLELRVINSPVERNEKQWLAGWKNRLKTYLPISIN